MCVCVDFSCWFSVYLTPALTHIQGVHVFIIWCEIGPNNTQNNKNNNKKCTWIHSINYLGYTQLLFEFLSFILSLSFSLSLSLSLSLCIRVQVVALTMHVTVICMVSLSLSLSSLLCVLCVCSVVYPTHQSVVCL